MAAEARVEDLVREALHDAAGDPRQAVKLARSRVEGRPELKLQLVEAYLDRALWDLIRRLRKGASPAPGAGARRSGCALPAEQLTAGLVSLARANLADLLDGYKLATTGTPLGSASRQELLEEAAWHERAARTSLVHVSFIRKVAKAVGSSAEVRRVLNNEQLRAMLAEARGEVGA